MRVILDTNVFVSGIFWEGNFCSQIIDKWKNGEFDLVSSVGILDEFVRTMKDFKIRMPEDMIKEWRNLIVGNSVMVEPTERVDFVEDDPDDNKFLEAGVAGKVDFIVSQDRHLLSVGCFRGIRIVCPEEFLGLVG